MKLALISLALMGAFGFLRAQSDGCSSATSLPVTANCSSPTNGTTTGATQTIAGCTGNADDDVWYQFIATSTAHQITVVPVAGMDPVVQLFSGGCASLVSLSCKDNGGDGVTEVINYNSLTIGQTYRVRVYHYFSGSGSGNFSICVTEAPIPPSNDNCAGAVSLNVNAGCSYTSATTDGATQSLAGCSGSADDDVWFSFVATNSLQNIAVNPISNLDLVYQVYDGSCGALTSLQCVDNTFSSQMEQEDIVGLVPGQTYYIRVYDYYQGSTGNFEICITGTPTPTPTNDEPCNAILLPNVTATCQFSSFTNVGATATMSAPTPASCVGGSGAAIGGFSASTQDVWFAIVVPPSGNLDVTPEPNGGAGSISDGVMALYSGSCNALTQIACSDDNPSYPGSSNDLLPLISESGLTPGDTLYLRYWGFGSSSGNFGICASSATNDDCANALYICDINGYSASTSPSYTPDRPGNMRGNNEDINGTNMPDGVNTGGIFGQGGPWGTGAAFFDVVIDNNSWIKFTAASTTAQLDVNIYDCWVGNYPSGGLQMQIFEGSNCANFVPVSNFEESSTGFTIVANNLVVGNDYYLMVDGYAGDICNYTITAQSGVQFPDIANVAPICEGESVQLTAPPGAASYEWQHNGATTQSITVTPSTTETYFCEVTGLCDYKQTLDVTVTVNPNPSVSITNGTSAAICAGESITLNASGATNYNWSTGQSGSSLTVSPATLTNYTVTGTDANGCTNDAQIAVTVNAVPTLTANPTAIDSDCGASNGALNGAVGSGANPISYEWSDGTNVIGNNANLTGIPAGTYYLTVTDGNICSEDFGPFNVANPGAPPAPNVIADDDTPCLSADVQLSASNTTAGTTFNWTGPNGFSATGSTVDLLGVSPTETGTYCVSSTIAGCTGPTTCISVTVLTDPTIVISTADNDTSICLNESFTINVSGADTFDWTGPNGYTGSGSTNTFSNITVNQEGTYTITGTDANGCQGTGTIEIDVLDLPTISVQADASSAIYCNGTLATLTSSGATDYSWTGPNNFSDSGASVSLLDLNASNEGYYVVNATDANSCESSDSVYLTVVTNVPASASGDTVVCPGDPIALNGMGGSSYQWQGPANFSSNEQSPLVTNSADFNNSGLYILTVVDANGCLGYDSTIVEVTNNGDCIFIPNLVTPDGDLHNDFWEINGIESYSNAEVEIYNRWGNLIYSASPYDNDWEGQINQGAVVGSGDEKAPVGTYFYIIRLNENDKPPYKGYIEVQY
ncbi:MAG: gliding motility-associated C-terminal domain-containing protein [bacterium]|nr:gliding motility-associated C-terminal domain-containing protein [bacterium]